MWKSQWVSLLVFLGLAAMVALAAVLRRLWKRRRLSYLIASLKAEELDAELKLLLQIL